MATARRTHHTVRTTLRDTDVAVVVRNEFNSRIEGVQIRILHTTRKDAEGEALVMAEGETGADPAFEHYEGITFTLPEPGDYDVEASRIGHGPPGSGIVREGPVTVRRRFLPRGAAELNGSRNNITLQMQVTSPVIEVRVFEEKFSGLSHVSNARVEIIGQEVGATDGSGGFVSRELAFGRYGVNVSAPGLVPKFQAGNLYHTVVELHSTGLLDKRADMKLDVVMVDSMSGVRAGPVSVRHPSPIRIWATCTVNTPHQPALEVPLRAPPNPWDGQTGWDRQLGFADFDHLLAELTGVAVGRREPAAGMRVERHQIRRLAILVHGAAGKLDINGKATSGEFGTVPTIDTLDEGSFQRFLPRLEELGTLLERDAELIFAACLFGDGAQGEAMLKRLSELWPTVTLGASRTICVTTGRQNVDPVLSSAGQFPGVRDTSHKVAKTGGVTRDYEIESNWRDLNLLPWLAHDSRHATVARDGNIIRRGEGV